MFFVENRPRNMRARVHLRVSSAEIAEATVYRIIHPSDEGGFIRAQEKSQGGYFLWCSHSSDGLSCG
jgi:hypothetical protein